MTAYRSPQNAWLSVLLLFLLAALGTPLQAAPRVVVSIPPLHALVADLMEGAGKPELLLEGRDDPKGYASQTVAAGRLANADLIIWVGPGLETALAKVIDAAPELKPRSVELAVYLPLPSIRTNQPEKPARELQFWLDPKLTMMAVRHLAPLLAQTDPANSAIYLENETKVLYKLRQRMQGSALPN